jgi:Xaa-Pro aminopeptidase
MRERLRRLREALGQRGLDGLVLAAPEHMSNVQVRYLTGFSGSSSYLVVSGDGAWLLTDFRYVEAAGAGADGYEVVQHGRPYLSTLADVVAKAGIRRAGFEDERLPVAMFRQWRERMPEVEWVGAQELLQELRLVKDAEEIAAIRRAARLAGQALEELLPTAPGRTERALAVALEHRMRELGLDAPGFDTIVASGERGSLPHARPGERVIGPGDMVTVDFGGLSGGYRSDETVTFGVGEVPARLREIFDLVYEAQAAGIASVRPGVRASEVDRACRRIIEAAGYGDRFGHGAGHGVGLDIHERPFAAREPEEGKDDVLRPGMTITVEPGIYLPGVGGARVEDTLVVTEDGCERLTTVPKAWRTV